MTRAKEMIFTGRRIDAAEAAQYGIAVDVVAREFLDEEAKRLAGAICRSSPVAVREAKVALRTALGSELEDGIEHEHSSWERVIASDDRVEGIGAFNDKRDPMWRNR
jgi:enoyl-CoA hydratase/carnithine racemase